MCQACLEAELWFAYQEEMAKDRLTSDAAAKDDAVASDMVAADMTASELATGPSADAGAVAPAAPTRPEPLASPFACEEPPST